MEKKYLLEYGYRLLEKAGNDSELLGLPLISFHGALERHIRGELAKEITEFEHEKGHRIGFYDLLELWANHYTLFYRDRDLMLFMNYQRNIIAHGEATQLSRKEIESYADFVDNFIKKSPSKSHISSLEDSKQGIQLQESQFSELDQDVQAKMIKLRTQLNNQFNNSELQDLCFDLGVDFEGLGGYSKHDKARELITFMQRRGQLQLIEEAINSQRPKYID